MTVGSKLPETPNVIFRKTTTLKDTLAPSSVNLPESKMSMFENLKVFFFHLKDTKYVKHPGFKELALFPLK